MKEIVHLHSILRWVVLATALYAIYRAFTGNSKASAWTSSDNKAGLFYTASLHLQFIVGFLLYFGFSPYFDLLKENASAVMGNSALRFYAVEHMILMLVAVIVATIGRAQSKRAATDKSKHKKALVFFTISLIIMLVAIPWPFRETLHSNWF